MAPPFLRRIQKKHIAMMATLRAQNDFAAANATLLSELEVGENASNELYHACAICGIADANVKLVEHMSTSKCKCTVHDGCLKAWTTQHDRKSVRIRVCPGCRKKRAGWQPEKKQANVCGSVIFVGESKFYCELPMGHSGAHEESVAM